MMKLFKNLKKQQWIITLVIVIIILGVVIMAGFFIWGEIKLFHTNKEIFDTPNDNDWHTYTNDEYGIEFQYPEGVIIEERDGYIFVWNKESMQKAEDYQTWIPAEFIINKISDEQIAITPEWLAQKDSGLVLQDFTESIGGKNAFVALPTELGSKTYIITAPKGTFMISAWGHENGKYYNQVIKTLKFLANDSWQTYTNNDYLYSIKYPSDWSINDWSNIIQILPPGEKSTGQYSSGPAIGIMHVDQIVSLNIDETNQISINNMAVTKWEFTNDVDTYVNLFFPRPEGGYIKVYWLKSLENKHKNFWEIIESITILNDNSPEWELYTDYELGISFRYPKLKWGKINIVSMKESDHNDNTFKSGKAKIIKFNKYYGASLSAFSNNFSHMYYQDPYLGDQDLSKTCTNEKILTDTGICKNINVGDQSTYENITDFGYECSFVDSRRISLNLNKNGYSGMLISQELPSNQNCGSLEIENMNKSNRAKDLMNQYNRENLQKSYLTNLELMDQVLSSFKFLN